MDAISQLLDLARVQARLDKRCLLAGTTVMDVPAYGDAESAFHFLLDGECTLEAGGKNYALKAGDAVLLPSSPPHRIRTAGAGRAQGVVETHGDFFDTIRSDSAGDGVIDLFCGHYTFGSRAGVLLVRSLPDPLVVSFGEGGDMVRTMSGLMRQEALAEGPGTSAILSSICTALLAMVLRQSTGRPAETPLWTAVDDKRIALVIDAVLRDPGADWSIERLAGIAALARATFLRRFVKNTGTTVGAFLSNVRMMAAADLLADREVTVAAVASKVGYHSESAFARAFQEAVGTTPGRFRRTL
ncbi:AraC family transcriptional regulator [Kribbella sp. VKM Ac-2568]|uniref:AraC family transcriptional regulator n=1 Tax=Kribbella sp. VKM Ac-2568 TaxID=2512219 RepID=UPI00104A723F|nr:AraC family transcriptional regulator [Kribbella sp. VKM Ac-2568]TCM43557.1 AraC family transcriptional activator of mtrCDE [Kribbella sp. VKM Ac-2568]